MIRLVIVFAGSAAIVLCDVLNQNVAGTVVGLLLGLGMMAFSLGKGGRTQPIGMAAPHLMRGIPKRQGDPTANVGAALAAAGVGSYGIDNGHFPIQFRIFYGAGIGLGILIALVIAVRSRNFVPNRDDHSTSN